MIDLLILDGPCNPKRHPNPVYRGTFRMHPTHFDTLPEDHEANEAWGQEADRSGFRTRRSRV
jgi:hypothetical protein